MLRLTEKRMARKERSGWYVVRCGIIITMHEMSREADVGVRWGFTARCASVLVENFKVNSIKIVLSLVREIPAE